MSGISSVPDTFIISVKEIQTLSYDFTNYLTVGQVVSNGSATLTNKFTGVDATSALSTVASTSTAVTLKLTASGLTANTDYLLNVVAIKSNGDEEVMETIIRVVA